MTGKEFKDLEKEFCDYETSVALKELGFREKCPTYYDTEDNVGLLLNTQWTSDYMPCQFIDCFESHNSNTSDDNSYVDAPTIYQAQKWLIDKKKLFVEVTLGAFDQTYLWEICNTENSDLITGGFSSYDTYEEALSEGIKKAIEILKQLV
jgi:hypothetical protein